MVEIQQLIIKGKLKGSINATDHDILKLVNNQIEKYLSKHSSKISDDQMKVIIEDITDNVLTKMELDLKP
tara:strand:+ start:175 stop:384 length:210 start_codon:yes stop_codon:yes gene_type:complete